MSDRDIVIFGVEATIDKSDVYSGRLMIIIYDIIADVAPSGLRGGVIAILDVDTACMKSLIG